MHLSTRYLSALVALVLVVAIMPFTAVAVLADSPASVLPGFKDEPLLTGLDHPMSIVYAPNGNVFVAEKRGTIKFYTNSAATSATLTADLTTNVHNFWDRGLMGLAVDPGYPAAGHNYIYVLYAYNHILGDESPAPTWPASNGGDDQCPSPPGSTKDGCVISGRLSQIAVNATTGVGGSEEPLITDWCQQFPSHSLGSLVFRSGGRPLRLRRRWRELQRLRSRLRSARWLGGLTDSEEPVWRSSGPECRATQCRGRRAPSAGSTDER